MKVKIPKWIIKLIPKNHLPASGILSFGMLRYEKASGNNSTTTTITNEVTTQAADIGIVEMSNDYANEAKYDSDNNDIDAPPYDQTDERNALRNAPYGLNEFYSFSYNSCLLVGSKILMFDGTEKKVEDLEINDELFSVILPGMKSHYHDYKLDSLDKVEFARAKVKRVVFDFAKAYYILNKKYKATSTHAVFAWKDKIKRFEWWRMKEIKEGDFLVNPKLEMEEVTSVEFIDKEVEVVSIGLKKYNVFFADGYMNHD